MINTINRLKHLAIIMDGNGRWAKIRGKVRTEGHKAGAETVRTITNVKNCTKTLAILACVIWSL